MSVAPAPGPTPPTSPAPPPGASPAAPQMGTSSATQPVPNRGNEAMAAQRIALIVKLMGETIGIAGGGSEAGLALADSIRKLAKYSPQGASNPSADQDALKQLALKQTQMSQMPKPPGAA